MIEGADADEGWSWWMTLIVLMVFLGGVVGGVWWCFGGQVAAVVAGLLIGLPLFFVFSLPAGGFKPSSVGETNTNRNISHDDW